MNIAGQPVCVPSIITDECFCRSIEIQRVDAVGRDALVLRVGQEVVHQHVVGVAADKLTVAEHHEKS